MTFPSLSRKLLFASIVVALGFSAGAVAQGTTSAIRGKISDADGDPAVNVTVTVVDERTGATRTLRANESGTFFATNLPVGGPYRVTVQDGQPVTIESISLGDIYNINLTHGARGAANVEEILVLGAQNMAEVAVGPSSTFSSFDMKTSVSYDRDIKDVYVLDPRMNLDGDSQVNCAGKHPRFNSISLDGISQNDRFGLNGNGYSTATGMPFPYEGVEQVSVELAPFDVTYGGFTACNVNAVTKSGSNEWTGTAFYELTGDQWRGDVLTVDGDEQDYETVDYEEEKKGFSLGGPLIRDKLFFYGAYEETEEPEFIGMGHAGSGAGVERPWLSQADYNRINDIASRVYGYDTGGQPGDGAQTDEKYMLRLDWQINDLHSLALIHNYYEGMEDRASDFGSNAFEFSNHFYQKGAESKTTTLQLRSQWTDAFSTEAFISNNTMDDSQVTVGDRDFADMQINIGSNVVYLGADDSRQANALNTESDFLKLSGQYLLRDHVLSFGYERETLSIFNQFVQHSRGGEYDFFDDSGSNPGHCSGLTAQGRFDDPACGMTGIDKFELGRSDRIYYGSGGGSNDPADASASFENTLNTVYLQDEFRFHDQNLTVVAGVRYDWFTSDDSPVFNQTFTDANGGLRNDANVDGVDLLMPRLGFTWEATDALTVRGGAGLYSGGNPNVWISNAWSNDGVTNVQRSLRNPGYADSVINDLALSGQGRPGYDVPQSLVDDVANTTAANASDSFLVLMDPDYEQPAEWKLALGGTYHFDNDMSLDVDYLLSRQVNPAYYVDVSQAIVGHTAAGQPIYDNVNGSNNLMLTNADDEGRGQSLSFVLRQTYDFGLDWMVGYAYTESTDVSPMTSSVAASNFENLALFDLNHPRAGISNYEVPHRFTARVSYGHDFFPGYETRLTAMFYRSEGQPQTFVMSSDSLEGDGFFGRHMLYVPGANDPNVVFGPDFDAAAFNAFVDRHDFSRGGFIRRNGVNAKWSSRLDFMIDQEIPTFMGDTRGRVYFKMYNVLNFIDDEWGHQYDAQFFSPQVVDMSLNEQGQYVFERFNGGSVNDLLESQSLWEARIGVQFEF